MTDGQGGDGDGKGDAGTGTWVILLLLSVSLLSMLLPFFKLAVAFLFVVAVVSLVRDHVVAAAAVVVVVETSFVHFIPLTFKLMPLHVFSLYFSFTSSSTTTGVIKSFFVDVDWV